MLELIAVLLFLLIGAICSEAFRNILGIGYNIFLICFKWFIKLVLIGLVIFLIWLCGLWVYQWCKENPTALRSLGSVAIVFLLLAGLVSGRKSQNACGNSGIVDAKVKSSKGIAIPNWIGWSIWIAFGSCFVYMFYLIIKS